MSRQHLAATIGAGSSRSETLVRAEGSASFQEPVGDKIQSLKDLLTTLTEHKVPGPQLFRLREEFELMRSGGQSIIYGIKSDVRDKIHRANSPDFKWPMDLIAIKRHQPKKDDDHASLGTHFLAARREILALAPALFQNHPNIVQLKGWGLCLDTIESPGEGDLQIPLLVLERGDMDFAVFLKGEDKPRPKTAVVIQLCRDIGNGIAALHEHGFTHGDLKPENVLVFKTLTRWVAKLCDFGCALQQHGEHSSSGTGTSDGSAKKGLSPFTGSRSLPNPAPSSRYFGTLGWTPPEVAHLRGKFKSWSHEELKRCDIYVYGLLAWSAICNAGESPLESDKTSPRIALENARVDIKRCLSGFGRDRARCLRMLEAALQEPSDRLLSPWQHLDDNFKASRASICSLHHTGSFREGSNIELPLVNNAQVRAVRPVAGCLSFNMPFINRLGRQHTLPLTVTAPVKRRPVQPPLTSREKERYVTEFWPKFDPDPTVESQLVTSLLRGEDYEARSLVTFEEPVRAAQVETLYKDMLEEFPCKPDSSRLYCRARFRSRVPLQWWMDKTPAATRKNMVTEGLTSLPLPDISTLAWICRGEIGTWEVQSIGAQFRTWGPLLGTMHKLNESERLERFLLLLQFGARVEQRMPRSEIWVDEERRSILFEYIRSCRRATVTAVMKEICSQFRNFKAQNHGRITPSTRAYMTGQVTDIPGYDTRTAMQDFVDAVNYEAVLQLHDHGFRAIDLDLSKPEEVAKGQGIYKSESRNDASRILSLLGKSDGGIPMVIRTLPTFQVLSVTEVDAKSSDSSEAGGWDTITVPVRRLGVKIEKLTFYRDVLTQSVTTIKPRSSLMRGSQVHIGYHGDGVDGSYVNVSTFIEELSASSASLRKRFEERFPSYTDEHWFLREQFVTASTDDILGKLQAQWRLPSFTDRIEVGWLPYFMLRIMETSRLVLFIFSIRLLPLLLLLKKK